MIRQYLFIFLAIISAAFSTQKNKELPFKNFTGKVLGKNVRLRTSPDLDGCIVKQLHKNDVLLVLGDEDEFWAVQPPENTKAYIFRSYILDNVVEANRVNIRLFPSIDAPIIGQLQQGNRINGKVSSQNNKWLEIDLPSSARFYISKEFVGYAGSPDHFFTMEKRRKSASSLLEKAYTVFQEEIKVPFEEMSPKNVIDILQEIISEYSDFPSHVNESKKLMSELQEKYLEKKMAYLEEKSAKAEDIKDDHLFPKFEIESRQAVSHIEKATFKVTDRLKFWTSIEQSLFDSWTAFHSNKTQDDFYCEQKANAIFLNGTIETYNQAISKRPGDFILKDKDNIPIAFLYSTKIDLDKLVGKNIKMLAAPRPNNHFAYPAYFVLDIR